MIDKRILHIAIPSIVSNITVPLLGLIDVAITGHLGSATYLGAIAVGGMLFNIIYWMFAFLRMGTSGMTAQARGRRDKNQMQQQLYRGMAVAVACALVILALSPAIREVALWLIAPSEAVAMHARTYFNICIFGALPSLMLFALNGWFVGMQNSRSPMAMAIAQNIINILASTTLVFLFGMKVEGIALGTVIAQWAGLAIGLSLLYRHYGRHFSVQASCLAQAVADVFRRGVTGNISEAKLGTALFCRTLCLITVHFFFISAGARQGDTELAVNTLLMQMFTLYSYFMDGFANAGEALAGKALGARAERQYNIVVRHLFAWGTAVATAFTLLYLFWGKPFLSLLTDEAAIVMAAMDYQPWTLLFPIAGMGAFIWDGIYIGATASRLMFLSVFASMVVFFIAFALLFPLFHNHGLWIAFITSLATRSIMQTITRHHLTPSTL